MTPNKTAEFTTVDGWSHTIPFQDKGLPAPDSVRLEMAPAYVRVTEGADFMEFWPVPALLYLRVRPYRDGDFREATFTGETEPDENAGQTAGDTGGML